MLGVDFRRISRVLACAVALMTQNGFALAGEVGPARVVEVLRQQLDESYDFIVTFTENLEPDRSLGARSVADVREMVLLNGFTSRLKVSEAFEIASRPDVRWVWYLHPDEAPATVRALQGLDYVVNTMPLPNIANLSLGPPTTFYRTTPEHDAPMPRALKAAADRGLVSVVAIGNMGQRAPGYINPWSTPPWVISVGAWDHTTGTVWSGSSTAEPDEIDAWPDVVAPGVDVIGPWPTNLEKTLERRAYDEANARFRETIADEDFDDYTLMTGTSQAAAVVSGAAAQVLRYLNGFIDEHGKSFGEPLFALEAGADRITSYDRTAPRLTGTASPTASGGMVYEYTLAAPWKLIKQILIDTAIPVEGAEPWQAGAGLVDPDYIQAQFGGYGIEPPKLLPVKVR